jgi:hypothetical protein
MSDLVVVGIVCGIWLLLCYVVLYITWLMIQRERARPK